MIRFYKNPKSADPCSSWLQNQDIKIGDGLLWWLSGKESACQSWALGFHPWSEKILHASKQLKPSHLEPVLCHKRSHCNQKPTPHSEEQPPLTATREIPHIQRCLVFFCFVFQKYFFLSKREHETSAFWSRSFNPSSGAVFPYSYLLSFYPSILGEVRTPGFFPPQP